MKYLFAEVKAADDAGAGTFTAIASMPTVDRDKEVIAQGAFNPLPETVPIHVDHNMSSAGLVGTGRPFYDGDRLMVTGRFAGTARAQEIRQLVVEGHLARMSVGFFDALKEDRDGVRHITRAELLEVSFVTVPSNREAMVLAAKGRTGAGVVAEARRVATETMVALALADSKQVLAAGKGRAELDRGRLHRSPSAEVRRYLKELGL